MGSVTETQIKDLLTHFAKNSYYAPNATDSISSGIMFKCVDLMRRDYKVIPICNTAGEISGAYPRYILIPDPKHDEDSKATCSKYETLRDIIHFKESILKAHTARCRERCPIPVILYKGKYICRSATLSGTAEVYCRGKVISYFMYGSEEVMETDENVPRNGDKPVEHDWPLLNLRRQYDIKLLKTMNVDTIVDLMVENKKVKYGLKVSSSEKIDKENRYEDFNLLSLPYPGCEFFKQFHDNNYSAGLLYFNWEQTFCDAILNVRDDEIVQSLNINWSEYKNWSLVDITQNYMKLILRYVDKSDSSILVHCISGWDRTPLFISLLRLSLWADGVIHKDLNALEITYLTIGYDWYLFGHQLPNRLVKDEDILYFCFYMLKHLTRSQYSILGNRVCGHKKRRIEQPPPKIDSEDDDIEKVNIKDSPTNSSENCNRWQMIPDTRSSSSSSGHNTSLDDDENEELTTSVESTGTIVLVENKKKEAAKQRKLSSDEEEENKDSRMLCRKNRLNEVCSIFKSCYAATISQMPKPQSTLQATLSTLAERVGITSPKEQ